MIGGITGYVWFRSTLAILGFHVGSMMSVDVAGCTLLFMRTFGVLYIVFQLVCLNCVSNFEFVGLVFGFGNFCTLFFGVPGFVICVDVTAAGVTLQRNILTPIWQS